MATICFYQDTRHEQELFWIREVLGIGYLSRRNDGMSELRINAYRQVHRILKDLIPYIRFKKKQAEALYEATQVLGNEEIRKLDSVKLRRIVDLMLVLQSENYVTKKKKTKLELYHMIGLTPYRLRDRRTSGSKTCGRKKVTGNTPSPHEGEDIVSAHGDMW